MEPRAPALRGEQASITDLATAEKINQSYVCRILRLSLLASDIVEAPEDQIPPLIDPSTAVTRPDRPEQAADGWAKVFAFLRTNLVT